MSFSATTMNAFVNGHYKPVNRNRMHATILQNVHIDTWMTYELMEASINMMKNLKTDSKDWPVTELKLVSTLRDLGSAKIANKLELSGYDVDNFFCFHGIKIDGDSHETLKHGNRPDGTFKLTFNDSNGSNQKMVLCYEGDNHGKDDGKSNTEGGCRNAHKIYQCFAQSQSYNEKLSACIIIAAIGRATAGFIPYIDAMFQAHVIAFAVITHYNWARDEKLKEATFLHKHLKLEKNVDYDFVIGINMATNSTSAFTSDFWTDRIADIIPLTPGRVEIIEEMKDVAGTLTYEFTIKSVTMVFIAVPRAGKTYLKDGIVKPCFLYPMHLAEVISFVNNEASVDVSIFEKVLTITPGAGTLIPFRTHMMHIKTLLRAPTATKNKDDSKDYCQIRNSEGFLLAALPVAYYTIQQLEFVNDQLKYDYYRGAKSFKKVLEAFKDAAFQGSTRKISVSMMEKNNRLSLFHEICSSVSECEDTIQEDLKSFLEEACLWGTTDGYSPVVFFRTMRIFSLQNAMDFAYDVQTGQNDAYSKVLLSYPIGTQIVIKQCMKKLTENGTPAYLMNYSNDDENLDDISDDEEEEKRLLLATMQKSMGSASHTAWNFELVENINATDNDLNLANLILTEFKKKTKWKVDKSLVATEIASAEMNAKILSVVNQRGIYEELSLDLGDFTPSTVYEFVSNDRVNKFYLAPILAKAVSVNSDEVSKIVNKRLKLVAQIAWGDKVAQFTLVSSKELQDAIDGFKSSVTKLARRIWPSYFS